MVYEKLYKHVRVVCRNKLTGCEFCQDTPFSEGYCSKCNRPLWKEIGSSCDTIIGYYDGNFKEVLKQGKEERICTIDFICRECNSITTRNLVWRFEKNDNLPTGK